MFYVWCGLSVHSIHKSWNESCNNRICVCVRLSSSPPPSFHALFFSLCGGNPLRLASPKDSRDEKWCLGAQSKYYALSGISVLGILNTLHWKSAGAESATILIVSASIFFSSFRSFVCLFAFSKWIYEHLWQTYSAT